MSEPQRVKTQCSFFRLENYTTRHNESTTKKIRFENDRRGNKAIKIDCSLLDLKMTEPVTMDQNELQSIGFENDRNGHEE